MDEADALEHGRDALATIIDADIKEPPIHSAALRPPHEKPSGRAGARRGENPAL
jgi:hypothetical protein